VSGGQNTFFVINMIPPGRRQKESVDHRMIMSVDLAKTIDKTAFTITEVKPVIKQSVGGQRIRLMSFHVHNISRLEPGRDFKTYSDIAKIIHDTYFDKRIWLVKANGKEVEPQLLVDAGGVGEPVCDELEVYMKLKPVRYKLVRGTAHVRQYSMRNWTVPRPLVFDMLDAAFGDNRIILDPRLALTPALLDELKNLRREQNEETGMIRVTHREGQHDDMAICLASTVWWTMQPKHGGMQEIRARPYGSDVALMKGEIDPRMYPVASRKVKPWRYS
jgi:hypothetical protein